MMIEKEVYENEDARFEVSLGPDGEAVLYWLQCGIAGLQLKPNQLANLYEILEAYMNEFSEKGGDNDST